MCLDYVVMLCVVLDEVWQGFVEGGILIGVVLFCVDGILLGVGYNCCVQENDLFVYVEIDVFCKVGRQFNYWDMIMVIILVLCWYCSGLVCQFKIGIVVVGELWMFVGGVQWLCDNGVMVIDLDDLEGVVLMENFICDYLVFWNEDIGEVQWWFLLVFVVEFVYVVDLVVVVFGFIVYVLQYFFVWQYQEGFLFNGFQVGLGYWFWVYYVVYVGYVVFFVFGYVGVYCLWVQY